MKTLIRIFLLTLSLTFLACQGQKEVRDIIHDPSPQTNQNNNQPQGGVDDGGGGNGINNRPLENFTVPLYKIPEFNSQILPIIEKVNKVYPRLASDMAHIALNRIWYFLPVELKKIPAYLIGPGFGDDKLQQMALQNLNSVYINSLIFEKMTDVDRATLLLHEIVMGIRLMKYKGSLDQCFSEIAIMKLSQERKSEYQKLKDQCALKYGLFGSDEGNTLSGNETRIDLTTKDYDNIREFVVFLESDEELSKIQLEAWLKDKKFRVY